MLCGWFDVFPAGYLQKHRVHGDKTRRTQQPCGFQANWRAGTKRGQNGDKAGTVLDDEIYHSQYIYPFPGGQPRPAPALHCAGLLCTLPEMSAKGVPFGAMTRWAVDGLKRTRLHGWPVVNGAKNGAVDNFSLLSHNVCFCQVLKFCAVWITLQVLEIMRCF